MVGGDGRGRTESEVRSEVVGDVRISVKVGLWSGTECPLTQSFRLELPIHLKRRGVHDVFHSSLLRIHVPNDDRLFPGRMDTQLGEIPEADDEWAVELIRSHAGSGEKAMFEIIWKSGDTTWMPYYQIKHLQALETYLELLGVNHASNLPLGKGKPPQDDPQVFIGALSLYSILPEPLTTSTTTVPFSSDPPFPSIPLFSQFLDIFDDFYFI